MIRCWWMTFFGEYRGHGTPHESPKVMTVPLVILAALSVVVGLVNIPAGSLNNFEKYVQPSFLFPHVVPDRRSTGTPPSPRWRSAWLGAALVLPVLGAAQGPASSASPNGSARWPGCTGWSRTSTASTCSTATGSSARSRARSRPGRYWFNQHVIDAVRQRRRQRRGRHRAASSTRDFDQKVLDGVDRRLRAPAPRPRARRSATSRPARSSSTPRCSSPPPPSSPPSSSSSSRSLGHQR